MAGIDVISDTTGKDMVEQLKRQNTLLSVISGVSQKDFIQSWDAVAQAVAGGYGPSLFSIGSTFTEPWKDTANNNTSYDNPWRVNHFHLGCSFCTIGLFMHVRTALQQERTTLASTQVGVQMS